MDIEEHAPNGPNFGLIVGLSCVVILIVFAVALLFVRFDGKHLTFRHRDAHPTSQLMSPVPQTTTLG